MVESYEYDDQFDVSCEVHDPYSKQYDKIVSQFRISIDIKYYESGNFSVTFENEQARINL